MNINNNIVITLGILFIFSITFLSINLILKKNYPCDCSKLSSNSSTIGGDPDVDIINNNDTLTILTEYGKVRGRKEFTLFGRKPFFAYKGIPYAQPPIGELRFKPPKESNYWGHVHDAFEYGKKCIQRGGNSDEDCLFLNIFVPSGDNITKAEKPLPVIFCIHGGGFAEGSGADFGPDFLIDQDNIIMVTINYRLGALGFMSLKTPEYSGNMGLKDISLAINWIHRNIQRFGGDPNQVTLYGFSAGSSSIELHLLTNKNTNNNLFQRAIMASGSAFNPWTLTFTNHTSILYRLAQEYDYRPNNLTELIDSLLKIDAHNFIDYGTTSDFNSFSSDRLSVDLIWVPVVEVKNAIDPFLIDLPSDLYRIGNFSTNIDLFIGTSSHESFFWLNTVLKNPEILEPFNRKFEIDLPLNQLNENIDFSSVKYQEIANKIRWHYFQNNNGQVNITSINDYARLLSDLMITYGVDRSTNLLSAASTGKTYSYVFSVNGKFNAVKLNTYANTMGLGCATHGDDYAYVIGNRTPDGKSDKMYQSVDENSMERQRMNELTRIYSNFIKHGIPTVDINSSEPKLLPYTATEKNYLNITNDGLKIERNARFIDVQFWNNILEI